MSNRRFEMFEYRQVLTRMRLGDTDRAIARVGLMGRRKVARLRRTAEAAGWLDVATPLPGDPELGAHLGSVRTQPAVTSLAEPHRERITRWWRQGVQGTTIHGALVRSHGFTGSYSSVRRFLAGVEAALVGAHRRVAESVAVGGAHRRFFSCRRSARSTLRGCTRTPKRRSTSRTSEVALQHLRRVCARERDHLRGELVATTRPALLRQQTSKPLALPSCPCLVERRTRQAECSRCTGDRVALGLDTTQHLVLDLQQVTGVEEVVLVEQRIGDRLSVSVEHTLAAQGLSLRIGASCLGHGPVPRRIVK